jgi:hypothetical protein
MHAGTELRLKVFTEDLYRAHSMLHHDALAANLEAAE